MSTDQAPKKMFWALVVLWCLIQAYLAAFQSVKQDEGAHLMDVWLVTQGLVPRVDFDSRQPLYVLLYLPFVWMGFGYKVARFVPIACTLGSALLMRRLAPNLATGQLAALLFLYSPTILMHTAVVKTEPAAILLACAALLAFLSAAKEDNLLYLFLAGVFCGLGFYVRQSILAMLLALLVLAGFQTQGLKRAVIISAGWATPLFAMMLLYSQFFSWGTLLSHPRFFPFAAIVEALRKASGWATSDGGSRVRESDQVWLDTVHHIASPIFMNLALVIAVAIALWSFLKLESNSNSPAKPYLTWLGCYVLLYTYQIASRGFHHSYFREFLPPMCLLGALVLSKFELPGKARVQGGSIAALLLIGLLAQVVRPEVGLTLAAPAMLLVLLATTVTAKTSGRPVVTTILATSLVTGAMYAGIVRGLKGNAGFPPSLVSAVALDLKELVPEDEEVLSGGLIWEFEARRRPMGNWSHPMSITGRNDPKNNRKWLETFREKPPRVIVLDGMAKDIFVPRFPEFNRALEEDYKLTKERSNVRLYLRTVGGEL